MKKKIIGCSIVSSFFALAVGTILSNLNFDKKVSDFDDVINEVEDVFDNEYAHLLEPKNAFASNEIIEPKVGVQISELENDKKSIRFVGLIQDLNVTCSFNRTMYDEEGNVYKEEATYPVTTAFSRIKMGDNYYTPAELNPDFASYNYFVTYTMKNIPSSYWYYALDVSLDVTTNTTDEGKITLTGENKANIQGAMKSYYASTFNFAELNDGTYEVTVSDNAKDEEYYEIPEYYNNYDGNVASKGEKVTSIGKNAFNGCSNVSRIDINSNITNIDESAFRSCVNLVDVYYEGNIESWCNISFYDEYSNPMSYGDNIYMLNENGEYELVKEIVIPNSVTEIGDFQFYNFNSVTNMTLHGDINSFGEKAFYNLNNLDSLYFDGTIEEYKALDFIDFHSDSSNYADKFYVKTDKGVYEEYIETEDDNNEEENPGQDTVSKIELTTYSGHLESAYAEWKKYSGATGYNAYYKLSSASSWTQVDNELIRSYPNNIRVDAVGLKAGSYNLKIIPIVSGNELEDAAATCSVTVKAHDRSGYAFVNGSSSGAYNDDGTLKSNALVIYVTNANKDTISVTPNISDGEKSFTGLGNIVLNWKEKYDSRPLNIRLIGNIEDSSSLDKGDLLVDGTSLGVTIEGIGNDATANGWGIRVKNSSNVEIRNIGLMNCDSSEGDNVGLQQGNDHIWVHNCDFFYGDAGSDADQAKGDGALDTKKSTYVTHSYNHFWDTGKTHLNGNGDTVNNYISYHHNWYDHSDSRHPRVRCSSAIHVYNNYFDGVAKYGIGATLGSSIYVEGNYFRNTKYPMLISQQGTDVYNGAEGTFSGEDGGIIKAYDNYIEGAQRFVSYSDDNSQFDAYVATSRNETVPSSVKTASGGTSYSNFDTESDFYSYYYESPEKAKQTVIDYAGRVQGGDFKWTFDNEVDDKAYDVNSALKSALVNYKTTLVSVGGGSISGDGGDATVDASEIIARIDALSNAATIDNVEEIKEVYTDYLTYDKSLVTNSAKIERLYSEALIVEVRHFEDLVSICGVELTLTNLETASSYYNGLSSSQKEEVATSKALLDSYYSQYELIAGQKVYELIEALPEKEYVTLDYETAITNANNAYNNLTNTQKEAVTNYNKLVEVTSKLKELKDEQTANEFVASVNELPAKNNLVASDLSTIETLLNSYNSFDDGVKSFIDESYVTKLNEYKEYINTYLVSEKTVTVTINDLTGTEGTTENGFEYQTNGEDNGYIKVKGTNYLSYSVETSSITMELNAKCTDSSEARTFTVTITYKDGTSEDFTFTTATGKSEKTFTQTFTGNITSFKLNGIDGKNLGVKTLTLTYVTGGQSNTPIIDASEIIARIDALDDTATLENASSIKEVYADYLTYDKELVTNSAKIEKLYEDVLTLEIERFDYLVTMAALNYDAASFAEAYDYYDTLNSDQQASVALRKAELDSYYEQFLAQPGPSADAIELIDELPAVSDVTLSDELMIDRARAVYDSLSEDEKAKVTNYSKLVELEARIAELHAAQDTADLFISHVNLLPETEELVASDKNDIDELVSQYVGFSDDVKVLIDESYVTRLYEAKTYVDSLQEVNPDVPSDTKTEVNISSSTLNQANVTSSTNGLSGDYIKLRGSKNNHITYTFTEDTESVEMNLIVKCVDSDEAHTFTVTVIYKDGNSETFTYTLNTKKADTTITATFSGNVESISVNAINSNTSKNLGVLSIQFVY